MPIDNALARVAAIQELVQRVSGVPASAGVQAGTQQAASFGSALQRALTATPEGAGLAGASPELTGSVVGPYPVRTLSALGAAGYGSPGAQALAFAQAEVGVSEDPPGSNDGGRIAEYRTATRGSAPGVPWCAYFVSWASARAGVPLGEQGQGYGAVEDVEAWAARTGRLLPAGVVPQPGDLILFGGRHIGIVESVQPNGRLFTVEGNHRDAVERVERSLTEATGFVRLTPTGL